MTADVSAARRWLDRVDGAQAVAATIPSFATDEAWQALEQARYETLRDVPRLTSAMRSVLDLADEWDDDHADWCCRRGCTWPSGRHLTEDAHRRVVEGVARGEFTPPGSLLTQPCPGACTCEVGRYVDAIRAAVAAASEEGAR